MTASKIFLPLILLWIRYTTTEGNNFNAFHTPNLRDGLSSKPKLMDTANTDLASNFNKERHEEKSTSKPSNRGQIAGSEGIRENEAAEGSVTAQQSNKAESIQWEMPPSSPGVELYEQKSADKASFLTEGQGEDFRMSEMRNDVDKGKIYEDHSDYFICGPCNCSTTAHSMTKVIAHCQGYDMRDIPRNVSRSLWSLEIYQTSLVSLNVSKILEYRSLFNVNVTQNKQLTTVSYDDPFVNRTSTVAGLILSDNAISHIDDHSFSAFVFLKTLNLQNNRIRNITNATFEKLANLSTLDLSRNVIKFIEVGAFTPLRKLKVLDLSFNRGMGYSVNNLSPALLSPLKSLFVLSIQGNSNGETSYPNQALSRLYNLQNLTTDGLNTEFGKEVRNLKNLISIRLTSRHLKGINQTFFENIPRLRSLEIFQSSLSYVDVWAYKQVNLTSLTMSHLVNYDLFTAFDDLQGLQHSQLKSLSLIRLYHRSFPCRFLNKSHAKYLTNIALERLDLSENLIALLGKDFADLLPKTLTALILRDNKFSLRGNVMTLVSHLNELSMIDLSVQNHDNLRGGYQDQVSEQAQLTGSCQTNSEDFIAGSVSCDTCNKILQAGKCNTVFENDSSTVHSKIHFSNNVEPASNALKSEEIKHILNGSDEFALKHLGEFKDSDLVKRKNILPMTFPPKLIILNASQFFSLGATVLTPHWRKSKLKILDFSKSFLSTWGMGSMLLHIEKALLSENYCKHIQPNFFKQNNSLVYLDLHDNVLGSDFAEDVDGVIFTHLSHLKYLDISFNAIFSLPPQFFKGLKDLMYLKLSDNKLQVLNTTFSHMTSLQILDLSRNSITWISRQVRDDLDSIGGNLSVDLTLNPLPCTCAAIDLLVWMANTKAHLLNKDFLKCRFDNGKTEPLGNLDDRVVFLKRMCASKVLIIVICVACLVVMAIITGCGLMYKHRWKLRYLLNITKARLSGFKPKGPTEARYKFDAYVIYGDETRSFVLNDFIRELEERRGHKLCVEDRDFMPGSPIIADILSGVQNSFKTVPVITPEFYDDGDYVEYSVQMALMEENYQKREVLHLCIYEPMGHGDMKKDIFTAMRRNSYTEYPPLEDATREMLQDFWDQLSHAIGHKSGDHIAVDEAG